MERLRRGTWLVGEDERYRDALAAGDRVLLYLAAPQRVLIDRYEIAFNEGESIHTENSHKYDDTTLATLAAAGHFRIERRWTDSNAYFADLLLVAE